MIFYVFEIIRLLNILYIHQYFKTPSEGGAIRSYYIARGFIEAGHDIQLITSYNGQKYRKKNVEGIIVHYLPVPYYNHYGFFKRVYAFLLFAHKAYYLGRKIQDIDLSYISSTPLTVGLIALKLLRKKGIPYIFEVRDLWPEAPIQIGTLKSRSLIYITRKFETRIYREAHKIVGLSPGILEYISGISPSKSVHFCPNLSDCSFFEVGSTKDESLLSKHKLGNAFVVGYFGAIGKVNALERLLEVSKISQKYELNVRFLLIGEGARKAYLQKLASKLKLQNIEFLPHMDKQELRKYLSLMDAAYISFVDLPVMEMNSPNKFFDALASGKLIISNTRGWIKDLIEKHDCGFYLDPRNPDQFVYKIRDFMKNDSKLRHYQLNSRRLAESTFEKDTLLRDLIDFIST